MCDDIMRSLGSAPGPRPHFPPSLQIPGNCASEGSSSNYVMPEELSSDAPEELHIVGVYEATGDSGFRPGRQGVVTMVVHPRPKPVALFLSGVESIRWRIRLDTDATLSRVFVQGSEPPVVEGVPEGVPVTVLAQEQVCAYAYGWEVEHAGGGYEILVAHARRLTGLTEASFQGCYDGREFAVPYWSDEPPTELPPRVAGDESIAREDVRFPGCEAVMAESTYCVTTSDDTLGVLGLDSGEVCPVAETTAPLWRPDSHSIAWFGEILYACSQAGLVRISLRTGDWEAAQLDCDAVAAHGNDILVMLPLFRGIFSGVDNLFAYPSYDALLEGRHAASYDVGFGSTRMTVSADTFYGAWHATDSIDVVDLPSERPLGVLTLEDYDDWILGMAVTDDGRLVVSGPEWGAVVVTFDLATGRQLDVLRPTQPVAGLSCVTP